jgi:glycerol-3-phosphate acyltransferase PlsX
MGGDAGPGVVTAALARSTVRHPEVSFLLHGDEALLKPLLAKRSRLSGRAEIRHTSEQVRMGEKPSQALRRGRNTSMWRAVEAVARKEAEVAISAGNTGALMAMSMHQLGVLEGMDRPAIAALWPTKRGQSVVLDVGANIASDADQLVEFAVMGEAFARAILGLERPTVGLLNVGAEDVKGNEAVRGAANTLRNVNLPIEFCGFVEGDDISEGTVDVVVTDGFTGNIALKTAEGTARLVVHFLRSTLKRSFFARAGAFLASGALGTLRRKLDPRTANGGIFLGLNGVVDAVPEAGRVRALDMAIAMARAEVNPKIMADLESLAPPKPTGTAAS